MKKSQLQEAIRSIVRRKLQERRLKEIGIGGGNEKRPTKDKQAKYAYFTDNTKKNVMLIGYGQISLAAMKAKLLSEFSKMEQLAKSENYDSIARLWAGTTSYLLSGLLELEDTMTEAVDTTQQLAQSVQINTDDNGKQMSQVDQKKISDLEAKKAKAQQDLENIKSDLAKKTKPYTDKINRYEKIIGDANLAIDRIKS